MALVGHISGSSQSNSVIGVSGSVIIANRASSLFPALPGTDVSFFVSGSSASDMALFGGGLVSSGSVAVKNSTGISQFSADSTGITVKDSSNNSKFTVASATGNTVVQGTLQSVGTFTATGGLTATSITGSITKLAGGGDYLVAGSNITLTTGSLGQVTIAATGGGTPGGADTQIQFNSGGSFAGDTDLTYNSTSNTLTGVTGSFYRVVATDEVRANGGSVTTTQTTFNLVNTTATTLNVGGAATTVEIGAATGTTSINNALTVDGNVTLGDASADTVTVNGTTTFAGAAVTTTFTGNSQVGGNFGVTGSAGFNGNVTVGDASSDTVTVNGTTTFAGSGVTTTFAGDVAVNGGDITTSAVAFNLVNGTATSVNFAGAGTDINIGAATGNLYLKNATTNVSGAIVLAGDIAVNGGDITSNQTSFNLLNSTVTTLNLGGAADVNLGGSAKTVTVAGALSINGNTTLGNDVNADTITFNARSASSLLPSADVTYNLGSSSFRWANIFTGDLHLRNDRGDYTLIEEADFLTIRFNKTGKRYKFLLEAVPQFDEELGNFSS